MAEDAAILMRRACKHYGSKDKKVILDNLDMTVPGGSIYGLLGASGCGKTTLLSCVLGLKRLKSGEVWVLGGKPGSKGSGVPGPRVGYMPQEVALVEEFTVKGAVSYFGRIFGMSNKQIDDRFEFLSNLLELPPRDRFIRNLSGGQQRRVSFAAALVHTPELLILDEPTVGLDPVLRASIWDHLVYLTTEQEVTVVITTHYIEEAKQADVIGLLRGGKLLAERSPQQLMSTFNTTSLEEVFLTLSIKQEEAGVTDMYSTQANSLLDSNMDQEKEAPFPTSFKKLNYGQGNLKRFNASFFKRMRALLNKNVNKILLYIGNIFFLLVFPLLTCFVFFLAIGGDPKGLKLAVVDEELGDFTNCKEYTAVKPITPLLHEDQTCDYRGLSCNYLSRINETKVYYSDMQTALDTVKNGVTCGVLHFHSNFSEELQLRQDKGNKATNETIKRSDLRARLDMANRQTGLFLKKNLLKAYRDLSKEVMRECNLSTKIPDVPMQFKDPVYGVDDENYAVFMGPGLIMSMAFFLATGLTSLVLITEQNEGMWERSIVAGVTMTEIVISHSISQFMCVIVQIILILISSFWVFQLPCEGNFITAVLLIGSQGFCGMCFGFLVSAVCDSITTSNYFALGSFYPYIFLCGMLWPLEGMPTYLRYVAHSLPGTDPILSLHNILRRGKGILDSQVYRGFMITAAWSVVQSVACVLILRMKTKAA